MSKLFYLSLAIAFIVGSCTVERRLHNSGYHVTWKKNIQSSHSIENNSNELINDDIKENVTSPKVMPCEQNSLVLDAQIEDKQSEIAKINPSLLPSEKEIPFKVSKDQKSVQSNQKSHLSFKETLIKQAPRKIIKSSKKDEVELLLLVILCFLLPPIAVGLKTNWDQRTVIISLILTLLCFVPGVIHALLVVLE